MKKNSVSVLSNIRQNPKKSLGILFSHQILFIILSIFIVGTIVLSTTIDSMKSESSIYLQLDDSLNGEDVDKLITTLELEYGGTVTYSSKNEELKKMKSYFGDSNKEILSLYSKENPLKNSIYVNTEKYKQIPTIAKEIKNMDGIFSVSYGGKKLTNVISKLSDFRIVSVVGLIIIMILSSMVEFYQYKKLNKDEILEHILLRICGIVCTVGIIGALYTIIFYSYNNIGASLGIIFTNPIAITVQLIIILIIYEFLINCSKGIHQLILKKRNVL